jgi:hypothetical protein
MKPLIQGTSAFSAALLPIYHEARPRCIKTSWYVCYYEFDVLIWLTNLYLANRQRLLVQLPLLYSSWYSELVLRM